MGIWIRSQNKECLAKVKRLLVSHGRIVNIQTADDDYDLLGDYETKERAIEVLDEIQNEILNGQIIVKGVRTWRVENRITVYQMPEK